MVFGWYAQYYDMIYKKKDYKKECAYLEGLFKKHAGRKIKTVLDLGCGTANHMVPFLKRGYKVAGVDASAPMLRLAARKLEEMDLRAELFKGRLQSFQLDRTFDAVLCLFSVIDYLTQKKDLLSALRNISGYMKKSSLFIFDFWNANAVTGYYSPRRKSIFNIGDKMLERRSVTKIDPFRHMCEVHYTCSLKQNGRLIQRDEEKHLLRYFAVDEMKDYLKMSGLKVLDVHPFLDGGGKIRKNTWDVTIVAQKA